MRCCVAIRAPSSWSSEYVKIDGVDEAPAAIISTGTQTRAFRTATASVRRGAMTMTPATPASSRESSAGGTEAS